MAQEFVFNAEADQKLSGDRFPTIEEGQTGETTFNTPVPREGPEDESTDDDMVAELAKLKHKLGEQGSQMGALKAEAAQVGGLRAEMDRMRADNAAMKAANAQQQSSYQNADIFASIPQDQIFQSPAERQKINEFAVAAATSLNAQQQTVQELTEIVNQLQQTQTRTVTGLSEAEEAKILAAKPYLNALSGNDLAAAMIDAAKAQGIQQVAPQQAANEVARDAARQESFTQSGNATASGPDMTPAADKLLRDFRSGKYDSAEKMKVAMRKIGIGNVDPYGRSY